ncbi:hypothetical protein FRX31_018383, partial [Thalictrum thalictroides]
MKNQLRVFSVVEKKSIVFDRRGNVAAEERILITEKGVRGFFKATTTEGGGRWLGRLMCELSIQYLEPQRYVDDLVSIVGTSKENRQG